MAIAALTISSRNYSSWSLRGWLMCKMAGLEFEETLLPADDPSARAELLLISPSVLVPCLRHEGISVWDTLAIGEYLNETFPEAGLLPRDSSVRAHCRSISGEMHSGFGNLRSALPMNLKAHYPNFKVWRGAQADIDRIIRIWNDCFSSYEGPYLCGGISVADAMYAPVVTRFATYGVPLDRRLQAYCDRILRLPSMIEWTQAAKEEPDIAELEVEF